MKSLVRLSVDNDNDEYIVDYRVRVGYYAGEIHQRRFKRFDSFVAFVLQYLFNLNSN